MGWPVSADDVVLVIRLYTMYKKAKVYSYYCFIKPCLLLNANEPVLCIWF